MDERYSDCFLISREGRRFNSVRSILAIHSAAFDDFFTEWDSQSREGKTEIHMEDSSSELYYLLSHIHGPHSTIFDLALPDAYICESMALQLKSVIKMAFKYDMEGEISAWLFPPEVEVRSTLPVVQPLYVAIASCIRSWTAL
jgi:hypothetical protein